MWKNSPGIVNIRRENGDALWIWVKKMSLGIFCSPFLVGRIQDLEEIWSPAG